MFKLISSNILKKSVTKPLINGSKPSLIISFRNYSEKSESYEEFTERYTKFFEECEDKFELKRGLNNCFSYDLVPSPRIIEAALRASRRLNDFAVAVRIFEGIKDKVEKPEQYQMYVDEFKSLREELGIPLPEEIQF